MIVNKHYGTKPCILHGQGMRQDISKSIFSSVLNQLLSNQFTDSNEDNLTVITTTNYTHKGCLEASLIHTGFNMDMFYSLGEHIRDWQLHLKLGLVNDFLEQVTTDYVLFCDSHDVITFGLKGIVDKFKPFGCNMLLNADVIFWPRVEDYTGSPPDVLLQREWEYSLCPDGRYPYLNSGVWIADIEFAKRFFKEYTNHFLDEFRFEHGGKSQSQDQLHFRHAFRRWYPQIQLDYGAKLFQTLNGMSYDWSKKDWVQHLDMKEEINDLSR